jgi:ferredoxin
VDTLLIAVGLSSCDELLSKARRLGLKVYCAGDTAEIAEASAAIFSGRITGRQIAQDLGIPLTIPQGWPSLAEVLRSRPGKAGVFEPQDLPSRVYPLIRCLQPIPCDPCREACPEGLISLDDSIMNLPRFSGTCLGCGQCVSVCPGLAINLVFNDYDEKGERALLMLPFELDPSKLPLGEAVNTVDIEGNPVGQGKVIAVRSRPEQNRRHLVLLEVPQGERLQVAGFTVRGPSLPLEPSLAVPDEATCSADPIVCRCERIGKEAIIKEIRAGVRDMNQLKALSRAGMGGCGGKTCSELVLRLFREEGIDPKEITQGTVRPLVAEAPLDIFVRAEEDSHDSRK